VYLKNKVFNTDNKKLMNVGKELPFDLCRHYRLSLEEYQNIKELLSHLPSRLELALFSALWSEHCSYKSSAIHLKKLFFSSSRVLSSLGENAGVVDIGQGEKIAFKIESHNHPSRIVPYHGAATGVGGILRDIFVMNARPIALGNYLCFGDNSSAVMKELLDGVVEGIGGYGNSIGIPNVTGQTEFHSSYNENIVMNALALGYFGPEDRVMTSRASGVGNVLVYVGAFTGRDGIHGASMASESFGMKSDNLKSDNSQKTCVQIGDPFYGKLLMEACLEAMNKDLVVAAQDMGAAGLISSSFEMISKGKMGMKMYLDRVPLRDSTMDPEDILLSESQERVLLLVDPDKYNDLKLIFEKWLLPVCVVGELIEQKKVELFWKDELLLEIDPDLLTKKAPCYERPYHEWKAKSHTKNREDCFVGYKDNSIKVLCSILSDIRGNDRSFIYRQYDQRVGTKTVRDWSFPFGVLRLPDSGRALGVCMGGRPHIMRMDSLEGGKDAIYEPALQLAAFGFKPLALTDGLNFGSPENKEVMSSFVACVEGMSLASRSLQTPIVSGNVSFYNETKGSGSISSSPATVMIGLRDSLDFKDLFSTEQSGFEKNLSEKNGFKKNIPEKKLKNYSVYLISVHQVFSTGLISDLYNIDYRFYGFLNPEVMVAFVDHLLRASLLAVPREARLVGKFGLAYALSRLLIDQAMKFKPGLFNFGMEIETNYDLFQERLYEVLVVLNDTEASHWKKIFGANEGLSSKILSKDFLKNLFKMEKIGVILDKPELSLNGERISVSDLVGVYKRV